MPYGRMQRRKGFRSGRGLKRTFRRRSGSSWGSALGLAKRAYSGYKFLRKLINVEQKFCDASQATTAQSTTATITSLSAISESSDYNGRTGLSVKAVSLYFRAITTAQSTAASGHPLRYIIFVDNNGTGTAPIDTDVLESKNAFFSPLAHTVGDRFAVLADIMTEVGTTAGGPSLCNIERFIKLDHHIKYSNTTTGTKEGQVYLLTIADTATGTEEPQAAWYSRIRYVDN